MAGFKTHITTSTLLGVGGGAAAYLWFDVPLPTSVLGAGLCGVSGMLPDLDSDSGTPLRESMCFAAAMVPMMLFHRFASWGLVNEWLILAGAGAYLFVRFVVTWLLKRYTVHRGMFHSIPAAIIAGQVAFLVAPQVELKWRILTGAAVMLGYLSHLVLDEIWSIQFRYGKMKLKSSFGTALKIFGRDWWPNFSTFAKLAVLTWVIVAEPSWLTKFRHQELDFIDGDTQVAADGPSNTATPPKTTRPPTVKIR